MPPVPRFFVAPEVFFESAMVLTRQAPPPPPGENRRATRFRGPGSLLAQLTDQRPLVRRWGARDLSAYPNAAEILLEHLPTEGERTVREVILASLGRIGGETVIQGLLPMLESDDAHLRNDATELLQGLAAATLPRLSPWLRHPAPETRALALSILAAAPADAACQGLRLRVREEQEPMLLAQVITHLGEVGTPEDLPVLEALKAQHKAASLVGFALKKALHRLGSFSPLLTPLLGPGTEATPAELDLFQELLERAAGLTLPAEQRQGVGRLLVQAALRQGKTRVRDLLREMVCLSPWTPWHALLEQMFPAALELMHQPETWRGLTGSVLGEVVRLKPPGAPLAIWSHSVRGGREIFAAAIHLLENWPPLGRVEVRLVESAPDARQTEIARRGIFPTRQLGGVSAEARARHFVPAESGTWQVTESLRQLIEFRTADLFQPEQAKKFRGFDVILCRDWLPRLSPQARREAAMVFFDALNPGGFLLLGSHESLGRVTHLFQVHGFPDALAYQKPVV